MRVRHRVGDIDVVQDRLVLHPLRPGSGSRVGAYGLHHYICTKPEPLSLGMPPEEHPWSVRNPGTLHHMQRFTRHNAFINSY